MRVVLADDEALLRRGLKVLLEADERVQVIGEAADGAELIEVVQRCMPDVVLVDVQMPGMDGLEAVRRLRTWAQPPAIAVLTTFDLDDYVATALDLGAQGFLLKDAEPEALSRAVVDLAAGGAVLDPRIAARLLPRLRGFRANRALDSLSARERQVLELVASGRSNNAIAESLALSEATVKSYVSTVLTKLGVENRVQAALVAHQVGVW